MKSSLVNETRLSPNYNSRQDTKVTRITPHCVVGQLPAARVADMFTPERRASANYIIGVDGELVCNVLEENRAWTSGNSYNDYRAITIECASDTKSPYAFNEKCFNTLKELIYDICIRYDKKGIILATDSNDAIYKEKNYPNFMVITYHRYFQKVECPGSWLIEHFNEVRDYVNNKLLSEDILYKVQVGAFRCRDNAEKLKNKLKEQGYSDAFIIETNNNRFGV